MENRITQKMHAWQSLERAAMAIGMTVLEDRKVNDLQVVRLNLAIQKAKDACNENKFRGNAKIKRKKVKLNGRRR